MVTWDTCVGKVNARVKPVWLCLFISWLMLLLGGCQAIGQKGNSAMPLEDEGSSGAPTYIRNTSSYELMQDGNPYLMEFDETGFFYFVMGETESEEEEFPDYQIYYQRYDAAAPQKLCEVADGYIRELSSLSDQSGFVQLSILILGENAVIRTFDQEGKMRASIQLPDELGHLDSAWKLLALQDKNYALSKGDRVYLLQETGDILSSVGLEGQVRELYLQDGNRVFAYAEKQDGVHNRKILATLDFQNGSVEETVELPDDLVGIYPFENDFLLIFRDRAEYRSSKKALLDFDKQEIFASQMQYLFGSAQEIKMISIDTGTNSNTGDQEQTVYLYTFREKTRAQETVEEKKQSESVTEDGRQRYMEDGRQIVYVAIPDSCAFQVEFHAKKYNQTSDTTFVKVERFRDTLEDYLGKGKRPDVIMFEDMRDVPDYVQKGLLVNLLPFFEENVTYSPEDIIPKAKEILGMDDEEGMYAMASKFRMLLRVSDGTELDENGKCDGVQYLKWYDAFLVKNEIEGMGKLEELLYANVPAFYDEASAKASFTSKQFLDFMQTYKEVTDKHRGKLSGDSISVSIGAESAARNRGLAFPYSVWSPSYRLYGMEFPDIQVVGMPLPDGENHVYLRLLYPMGILEGSECKDAAFDFIMYYNSITSPLLKGYDESDYGKNGGVTEGYFSVFESMLKKLIYETEDPFNTYVDRDENGQPVLHSGREYFYTKEQKEQLRRLLDSAIPDTDTQRDIYDMLMEEMDAYLNGNRDLISCCEILQKRAELYLKEQR